MSGGLEAFNRDETKLAEKAIVEVIAEYNRSTKAKGAMNGPHEGYAVILEELDELWDEVRKHEHDRKAMAGEAVQIGAMALRFLVDVCY